MLNVNMLNGILLNVIMMNVVAPPLRPHWPRGFLFITSIEMPALTVPSVNLTKLFPK